MRFGIHLPQYGRAAGGDAIVRAARLAEELGFERIAFEAAGIQHVVSAPWRSDPDDWLESMRMLASILGLGG